MSLTRQEELFLIGLERKWRNRVHRKVFGRWPSEVVEWRLVLSDVSHARAVLEWQMYLDRKEPS